MSAVDCGVAVAEDAGEDDEQNDREEEREKARAGVAQARTHVVAHLVSEQRDRPPGGGGRPRDRETLAA